MKTIAIDWFSQEARAMIIHAGGRVYSTRRQGHADIPTYGVEWRQEDWISEYICIIHLAYNDKGLQVLKDHRGRVLMCTAQESDEIQQMWERDEERGMHIEIDRRGRRQLKPAA